MLSHTKYLTMKVPNRMDFVNITGEVEKAVKESRVREGLCLVNAASVFINDDEPGLHEITSDGSNRSRLMTRPERLSSRASTGEDNGDAHHKRQVMGREVVVAITAGKLDFGPWEQIFTGASTPPPQTHPDQSDRQITPRQATRRFMVASPWFSQPRAGEIVLRHSCRRTGEGARIDFSPAGETEHIVQPRRLQTPRRFLRRIHSFTISMPIRNRTMSHQPASRSRLSCGKE